MKRNYIKNIISLALFSPLILSPFLLFFNGKFMWVIIACFALISFMARLNFKSKLVNFFAIPTIILLLLFTVQQIFFIDFSAISTGISLIFILPLFLAMAMGIVVYGLLSIIRKVSYYKLGQRRGVIKATGSTAVGWGAVFTIIGIYLLSMILSFIYNMSPCEGKKGFCVLLHVADVVFTSSKYLPARLHPIFFPLILASIIAGLYSLWQSGKERNRLKGK